MIHMNEGMICFSGGKDSTAMLMRMLELDDPENYPITRIVFSDTDFEFPDLYSYLDRIQKYLDENYPERKLVIERVRSKKSWDDWFYGEITSGKSKGKPRGAPLVAYPCWWSREAKVYPLQRVKKEMNNAVQFVGIAWDEKHRAGKDDTIRYPLIEWKWTEADCMAYLDHLGLGNILYTAFSRLGCFHCIKQPPESWYQVWKTHPDLFDISIHWDEESHRISNHGLVRDYTPLREYKRRFEEGWVPKNKRGVYECLSCDAVAFHSDGTVKDEDFETDDAIEHDPKFHESKLKELMIEEEQENSLWVPPSHIAGENVEAGNFDQWFCD